MGPTRTTLEIAMKFTRIALATVAAAALALGVAAAPSFAQMMKEQTVTAGGAPMYPSKNIIQNAVNSKDHTTLVAAVKAAGLVDTLQGTGPLTLLAPTHAAFGKGPTVTGHTLLRPDMKEMLVAVLTYRVVPGRRPARDLMDTAKKDGGRAKLKTVDGEELTVEAKRNALTIWDAKGNASKVTIQNVFQSNGVIHVVDSVLLPSS